MGRVSLLACLAAGLLLGTVGCASGRIPPGRKGVVDRYRETFQHLRVPSSSEWGTTLWHLRSPTTLSDAIEVYADTGRTEGGVGVVANDLFSFFVGPYDLDGLESFFQHLEY
ncbi:MAG: hypothetical protein AAF488_16165 [Planctomycetota bacterium]